MALKNYSLTFTKSALEDQIELKTYMLVHKSYLFFYVVDEEKAAITVLRILNDGRDWMSIIKKWLRKNGTEK